MFCKKTPIFDKNIFYFELDEDVSLELSSDPFLLTVPQSEIEAIWATRPKEPSLLLFNGSIAHLQAYSKNKLTLQSIDYNVYYAWKTDSSIKSRLHLAPIGVVGYLEHRKRVLLGTRSKSVINSPGALDLVPSGSIDIMESLDPYKTALRELKEEAAFDPMCLPHMRMLGLFWSIEDGIWDIAIKLELDDRELVVLPKETKEYSHLFWTEALLDEKNLQPLTQRIYSVIGN